MLVVYLLVVYLLGLPGPIRSNRLAGADGDRWGAAFHQHYPHQRVWYGAAGVGWHLFLSRCIWSVALGMLSCTLVEIYLTNSADPKRDRPASST